MNRMLLHATIAVLLCAAMYGRTTTTFSGSLKVWPIWAHSKTEGATTVSETFAKILDQEHASGTNASQMNAFARSVGTLTNGQVRVLDVEALPNSFGDTLVLWRVNVLAVKAGTNNVSTLSVGDAEGHLPILGATNQTLVLRPGGMVLLTAPDATGCPVGGGLLRIKNDGTNAASYEVYVGGAQ